MQQHPKRWVALSAIVFLTAVKAGAAEEPLEQGPEPLAANFMAQLYDVKPDRVTVEMRDVAGQKVALAKVDGHACEMEVSPAPFGVSARYGWLVDSLQCEQGLDSNYRENNAPR